MRRGWDCWAVRIRFRVRRGGEWLWRDPSLAGRHLFDGYGEDVTDCRIALFRTREEARSAADETRNTKHLSFKTYAQAVPVRATVEVLEPMKPLLEVRV